MIPFPRKDFLSLQNRHRDHANLLSARQNPVLHLRPRPARSDLVRRERTVEDLHLVEIIDPQTLERCAPGEVVIFGVTPKTLEPGLSLSAEVGVQVPEIIRLVLAEVAEA